MSEAITTLIPVFCIATMFAMGLDVTLDDIVAPFRNKLALVIIVLVNNILVPLLGFVIIVMPAMLMGTLFAGLTDKAVLLTDGVKIGFFLLILATGGLWSTVLATFAGAKVLFAKGMMILLVGASILLLPFELQLFCKFADMNCDTLAAIPIEWGAIFTKLLLYQLLPLALGILIKSRYERIAVHLRPLSIQLTGLTFLIVLIMLVISGEPWFSLPAKPPVQQTTVDKITVSTPLNRDLILTEVENWVGKSKFSSAGIAELSEPGKWVIFDEETSYDITVGGTEKAPALEVAPTKDPNSTNSFQITGTFQEITTGKQELNKSQISDKLLKAFSDHQSNSLNAYLAVTLGNDTHWMLVVPFKTYFVDVKTPQNNDNKAELTIYQELPEPLGLIGEFVKTLAALPAIGPVLGFLLKLIGILVPYAIFVTVAALLMVIGYYSGVAVRNVVGVTGADIPRTLAIAATVRNVSAALIVANLIAPNAVGIILIFYTVSLIVAAIQADKWVGQPDTAPVPPTIPSQTAVIASERGATSTP